MPDHFDVAIVGAGAAGLAAARTVREAGASCVLLEASGRIGGRAFTDSTSFSQPWDLGCHWLHSAESNPFVPIADALGFRYRTASSRLVRNLRLESGWASAEESAAAGDSVDAAFDVVRAAGEAGRDVAASEVLPTDRWSPLVRHWLALMTASPPESISTRDFAAYADGEENWPVIDGYGALVAAYHASVPVTLDCPVRRIDWSGKGAVLTTPKGDVRAQAVIIAVPISVISAGRIVFTPDLPHSLSEALAALTLGVAEKVAIGFDRDVFGYEERTGVTVCTPGTPLVNFQILPGPRPLAIGHMAGPAARALMDAGEGTMADAAKSALAVAFGSQILKSISSVRATEWADDPNIGGGYSSALPGRAHLRARLLDAVADRLFFAGEAARLHDFSTCHGAHLSGLEAAHKALQVVRAA